jgi:PAS domain S-box-containing protein
MGTPIHSKDKKEEPNDLFFDMFDNSAIVMYVIEKETSKFLFANKSFIKNLGYSKEEIIGKTSLEIGLITPKCHEKFILQYSQKGIENNIKTIFCDKKQNRLCFLASIQAFNYGKKRDILISLIDITKQQKMATKLVCANKQLKFQTGEKYDRAAELLIADKELAFQKNEKQKRVLENKELEDYSYSLKLASQYSLSLIEASRDPLFTISPKGIITDTNQASVRVTDVSREVLIGSNFIDYFTNPTKAEEAYQDIFYKGFIIDFPLTIMDGEFTDVLFNGSVYKDEIGNVIGAVVVGRDISEQKRIEKEIVEAKIFAELATSIAEEAKITAEIATKNAEDAVRSKQQFLSNMSHEIRTPMNAIIGFTKVVLKTDLTAKQKEYLTAIKMSGDALIVLINDILDLAKVDAGKMTFEKTAFKLNLSIKAMLHLFETKIQEKNLKLIINYDPAIPEVLVGDPVRLHQIILNLVSNAVKFTNSGTIKVNVNLMTNTDEFVTIKFAITDTGIGIKEKEIEKIFENFQQATSGTSRLFGGTGLGLAIVKQLVEAQNGTIEVKSIVGKGSSFSFTLKFKKTNAEAVLEPEILELNTDVKNIKILVAEDMELNQLLMKTLLDDFGFECEIASNGKIAVEKLKEKTFDIILMDLQMPEMNGFEATTYIRKKMKLDIPIIALTADVTTVDVEKCKEVGMNDYISKPIDERLLYSKLIGFIKKPVVIIEQKYDGGVKTEKIRYVDLSYLLKLTKSNPILMSQIIQSYLTQTPPLINAIKQSFKNEDWHLLKETVHKIIPSFAIMGMNPEITHLAQKIQEFAFSLELSKELEELILKLEIACKQSCSELEIELVDINKSV